MHALTLARQRLRARIQDPATPRTVRLAHGLAEEGRGRLIPVLSSALAQDILTRGYDPRTLDRIYANRPDSSLGLMGRIMDRAMLDLPVHHGLRECFDATVGEMCAAAVVGTERDGLKEFRVLCAPCGLANEIVEAGKRLRARHPEVLSRVRFWGVEPDLEGSLLPEAKRRAWMGRVEATFIREDLRRHREVRAVVEREGPFHLIDCVGVCQKFSLVGLTGLVRFYTEMLAEGGTLLIDRWQPAEKSRVAAGLGIRMRCDREAEFHAMLRAAGLEIEREHPSGEGGCVLVVASKPHAALPSRASESHREPVYA